MSDARSGFLAGLRRLVEHRRFVPGCFALGLALRLILIFSIHNRPESDYRWYFVRAQRFAEGKGYIRPQNIDTPGGTVRRDAPTAYWPVGYPAFLGGVYTLAGHSAADRAALDRLPEAEREARLEYLVTAGKLANLLLGLGIMLLSCHLARRLSGSEFVARLTLAIMAVYPNQIAYTNVLASEPLFLFLLLAGMAAFVEARRAPGWAIPAGILFGVTALVKPQGILVPAFLIGIDQLRRFTLANLRRNMVLFVLTSVFIALTITPWIARNYRHYAHFVFISNNGGWNLLIGNHPGAGGSFGNELEKIYPDLNAVRGEYRSDQAARRVAIDFIKNNPLEALMIWPKKLRYLYLTDADGFSWISEGLKPGATLTVVEALKWVAQLFYMAVMLGFAATLWVFFIARRALLRRFPDPLTGLLVIVYFTLIYLVYFGDGRFHYPLIPFIVMYVAAGVAVRAGAVPAPATPAEAATPAAPAPDAAPASRG